MLLIVIATLALSVSLSSRSEEIDIKYSSISRHFSKFCSAFSCFPWLAKTLAILLNVLDISRVDDDDDDDDYYYY